MGHACSPPSSWVQVHYMFTKKHQIYLQMVVHKLQVHFLAGAQFLQVHFFGMRPGNIFGSFSAKIRLLKYVISSGNFTPPTPLLLSTLKNYV